MEDSKGNKIKVGMSVEVPEPNDSDLHSNEFVGHVVEFRDDNIIVQDQDNMFFEIEPERVTVNISEVIVSREEIVRIMQSWIEEADHKTIMRVYNENFDEPISYDSANEVYRVPETEADRVGMDWKGF